MIVETNNRGMAYFCMIGLYLILGDGITIFLKDRLYIAALAVTTICIVLASIFFVALRRLVFTQEGITVKFAFYQKTYKWNMFSVKRMETYIKGVESAFFSLKEVNKPLDITPTELCWLRPFSCFCVNFKTKEELLRGIQQCVLQGKSREEFLKQLEEWGVELEFCGYSSKAK